VAATALPPIPDAVSDPITLDDIEPERFLTDNIMVFIGDTWAFTSRQKIRDFLDETPNTNIAYACKTADSDYWDYDNNVDPSEPLFRISMIDGVTERAFVSQKQLNTLLDQTHQYYLLKKTDTTLKSTVSRSVFLGQDTEMLGVSHCQAGHGGVLYELYVYDTAQ
jgi:hypothetical protein